MKVLVIGSGGREHALVKACNASPLVDSTIAAPGNGGIAEEATCFSVPADDIHGLVELAKKENVDFVIVGPEVPLCLGIVDELAKENILAYGPTKQAAQLEASKAFTKHFLEKYNIPTAKSSTFKSLAPAIQYLKEHPYPVVIKASGLAAGKGVVIAQTFEEAVATTRSMLAGETFGESGLEVVIEEFLQGEEVSLMAIVSGESYRLLPACQDHKQIGEGDTGPNTGGMGAYGPVKIVNTPLQFEIEKTIIHPALAGLKKEGIHFQGTLFVGLMLTQDGPQVLEFNVRLGDPETQALLPLFVTDPIEILYACAQGKLSEKQITFKNQHSIAVVQVAEGYPSIYEKGYPITFPETIPKNTQILHSGTQKKNTREIVTAGGRVLTINALGNSLEEAASTAYDLCKKVHFKNNYYRKDIGAKELKTAKAS